MKNSHRVISAFPLFAPKVYAFFKTIILPLRSIDKILPPSGTFLDVGCGYGVISLHLAGNKLRHIIATDIQQNRINIAKIASAKLKTSNISFYKADLLKGISGSFDTITAFDLLHHLNRQQQRQFFASSFKLLKNGGFLYVKEINTSPAFKFWFNWIHDHLYNYRFKTLYLSPKKFFELADKAGFKIISKQVIPHPIYPHIMYICQK